MDGARLSGPDMRSCRGGGGGGGDREAPNRRAARCHRQSRGDLEGSPTGELAGPAGSKLGSSSHLVSRQTGVGGTRSSSSTQSATAGRAGWPSAAPPARDTATIDHSDAWRRRHELGGRGGNR